MLTECTDITVYNGLSRQCENHEGGSFRFETWPKEVWKNFCATFLVFSFFPFFHSMAWKSTRVCILPIVKWKKDDEKGVNRRRRKKKEVESTGGVFPDIRETADTSVFLFSFVFSFLSSDIRRGEFSCWCFFSLLLVCFSLSLSGVYVCIHVVRDRYYLEWQLELSLRKTFMEVYKVFEVTNLMRKFVFTRIHRWDYLRFLFSTSEYSIWYFNFIKYW